MATSKTRINISVSKRVRDDLKALAKRDQEPVATAAARLLQIGIELEEDRVLSEIARKRDVKGVKWVKDTDKIWR